MFLTKLSYKQYFHGKFQGRKNKYFIYVTNDPLKKF